MQCNCKRGNLVKPDRRADVGIGPYRLPCKIVRGAAIAVHLQKGHYRRQILNFLLMRCRSASNVV